MFKRSDGLCGSLLAITTQDACYLARRPGPGPVDVPAIRSASCQNRLLVGGRDASSFRRLQKYTVTFLRFELANFIFPNLDFCFSQFLVANVPSLTFLWTMPTTPVHLPVALSLLPYLGSPSAGSSRRYLNLSRLESSSSRSLMYPSNLPLPERRPSVFSRRWRKGGDCE